MRRLAVCFVVVSALVAVAPLGSLPAQESVKPVKALLITGGCCHDYARQKETLKRGIESRAMVEVTLVHSADKSTKARFDMYDHPDWAKGYDVIIHDECSSDVIEQPYVDNILNAHRSGVAAVNLHCAMHSYRINRDDWFQFVGIHSTGHGPQKPIEVTFVEREHPISRGLENWTTINEELYNNIRLFDTTVPLARGRQDTGTKVDDFVVAWANTFGKARVFSTTLGHNNETVADPRYLDLVTRGLLWSVGKLTPEYQKPFAVPRKELVPINLARGKQTTATNSQEGHPPEHAVDGNDETRWCSPDGAAGQSWQVDLGEPQELTGCRIVWEMDETNYRYLIEGSADGNSWTTLSDQRKTDLREQSQTLKFSAKGIRHVRITITGLVAGRWGSFYEFEVHGTRLEERIVDSGDLYKPRSIKGEGLLAGIKAAAGFEVSLFAAPPQITYPVCVACDSEGTVYVGIDENGSLDKQPGRGRIVRCRDADDDGKADELVTFANVDSPRGIIVTRGIAGTGTELFVLHPPHLSVFRDRDGDGVSDEQQILVRNIGFDLDFRGADHTTNGIQMGIDGWIYIAVGDYGFIKATGSDGREVQMKGGGIARVRPDGAELELVSRGQRNIYDVAVSPLLDLFTRDNTNDGGGWNVRLSYVPHGAQMGYPSLFLNFPEEIVPPLADYGGGSPCGSLFVDEPGLPGELGQTLYTCDWGRSIVYRHPLTASGAGFLAGQEPFLELPRPTDMDVDRFGNLYVSSWKDGGFNFGNPNVGYVIKVRPPLSNVTSTSSADSSIDWVGASPVVLIERLASCSHTVRLEAQREILRRKAPTAFEAALRKLAVSENPLPVRVAALFTLKQLQGRQSHPFLAQLIADPATREYALRAIADRETQLAAADLAPFLIGLKDTNPRVRLQSVRGLGRFHLLAGDAARHVADQMLPLTIDRSPLVAHIAVQSLVQLNASGACLATLRAEPVDQRFGAARVLQHLHEPVVVDALQNWLAQSPRFQPEDSSSQALFHGQTRKLILKTLCRLYHREADYTGDWWGTRPDTSGPYYKPTTWSHSERIAETLTQELGSGEPGIAKWLLPELKRHKVELPGTQERLVTLAQEDRDFFPRAVELLSAGSTPLSPEAIDLLEVAATVNPTNVPQRVTALRGLQRRVEQPGVFDAAVRSFAEATEGDGLAEIAQVWNEFVREPKLANMVSSLAQATAAADPRTRELAYAALTFISEAPPAPADARNAALKAVETAWLQPDTSVSLLRGIGRGRLEAQVFQIQQQLKSEFPEVQEATRYAVERLELDQEPSIDPNKPLVGGLKYEEVLAQAEPYKGDAKYGKRLFSRQGCVACHSVSANEPVKGPLLLDIAKRYKRSELIESIVKPSAKIAQGFETQFFATSAGKIFDGFVVRESGEEIELRNVAGVSTVLKKDGIEERGKRDVSIMPAGLVDRLNAEQLASLVAYLESLTN